MDNEEFYGGFISICSRHVERDPSCDLCNIDINVAMPHRKKKHEEAVAAGLHVCNNCQFEYYKTTKLCPKCGYKRKENEEIL